MCQTEASVGERLQAFTGLFRDVFRRQDQVRWFTVYLQGLLRTGARKTIRNLARTVRLPPGLEVEDVAQALQHFINQSPWDEGKVRRRYQALAAQALPGRDGLVVLEEMVFVKQGRHSVGVQRQYSRSLGRKTNCQIAVALHFVAPGVFLPLSLRLYLPRNWLQDESRLKAAGVPFSCRSPLDRTALALELLDEARAANLPAAAMAPGGGWGPSRELEEGASARGLAFLEQVPSDLADEVGEGTRQLQETLGLDHFEGRSWRGFHHHACLVLLAHGFLTLCPDLSGCSASPSPRWGEG